ncbi:MAG: C40 family peptidase [Burkholderiales bacterium]
MHIDRLSLAAFGLIVLALGGCSSAPKQTDAGGDVGASAARHALAMQGKPYRPGGDSPRGFDCSGLVQYSYARANTRVPRSTEGQWAGSRAVARKEIRPGDLLFFHQEGKRNSHVAIYVGNNRFVHAPSSGKQVSTASLTDRYWSQHFAGARRLDL